MKVIGIVLAVLIGVFGLVWLFEGETLLRYSVFAPRYEQQRRTIFEQSRAFNQGMVQELENMQFEYVKASPEQRDALSSIILHRASGYDMDDPIVPQALRSFINGLRRDRTTGER